MSDFDYCPTLAQMISTRTAVGASGKVFHGLDALSTTNNLLVLREFMRLRKPARTLEVGLSYGGSALAIASGLGIDAIKSLPAPYPSRADISRRVAIAFDGFGQTPIRRTGGAFSFLRRSG